MNWNDINQHVLIHTAADENTTTRTGSHYIKELIETNNQNFQLSLWWELYYNKNNRMWWPSKIGEAFGNGWFDTQMRTLDRNNLKVVLKVICREDENLRQKLYDMNVLSVYLFRENLTNTIFSMLYSEVSKEWLDSQGTEYQPREYTVEQIQRKSKHLFDSWLDVLDTYKAGKEYLIYERVKDNPKEYFKVNVEQTRKTNFNNRHVDLMKRKIAEHTPVEYVNELNDCANSKGLNVRFTL